MQASALRWSQCISSRSNFSLVVGSGRRSAAGGGAGGRAEAVAVGDAGVEALAAGTVGTDSLLLAGTAAAALAEGDGAAAATVALGVRAAIDATGRSGISAEGKGAVAGARPELPIAARVPAVPPTAMASQVATRAPISSALGVRAMRRRSACGRGRPRTNPSGRGCFPGKAGDL